MSSLFDSAQPIEPRRDHRSYRPEGDPFADIPGADISVADDFSPRHKDDKKDPVAKLIMAKEAEFRRRSKEYMEALGYVVYDVASWVTWQQWDPAAHRSITCTHRRDLYGLFDLEAFKGLETIGVQFTSRSHLGDHVTKMCAHEPVGKNDKTWRADYLRAWLSSGRQAWILGFYQDGGKGSRWQCEVRRVTLESMDAHEPRRRARK